ncbi:MAG: hypothetical protein J6N52_13385 [Clostridia bacterium]|nr:hypothetical protein [Clostridia bacterium]
MKKIISLAIVLSAILMSFTEIYASPPEDGLILSWDCNEAKGRTVKDSSMYRINGILNNVGWETDEDGKYLKFSYDDVGRINFGSRVTDSLARAKGLTFAAWLKLPEDTSSRRYRFFGTYMGGVVGSEIYYWPNQNAVTVGLRSCPQDPWLSNTYNVKLSGDWVHIAVSVSYMDKYCCLYINGCEVAPKSASERMEFKRNFYDGVMTTKADYIGGDGAASMEGLMDEVRVYRRALTKNEIKMLSATKETVTSQELIDAEKEWEKKKVLNGIMPNYVIMHTGKGHYLKNNCISVTDKNYIIKPYNEEGDVFVPLKAVAEAFDYTIKNEKSNVFLYRGNKRKKPVSAVVYKDGAEYISAEDAEKLFGVKAWVSENGLIAFGKKNLDIVADEATIGQIEAFFDDELYPEPFRNHSETRVVVAHEPKETAQYIGSPSLIRLDEKTLLASHDFFGSAIQSYAERVYRSDDNGKTWKQTAELTDIYWATMFESGGSIYMLGATKPGGSIVIRRSSDGGYNWTDSTDSRTGLLFEGEDKLKAWYHAGSSPVLKANGRVYKGFENSCTPESNWRHKYAFVISAPENSDLLNADNWTMSEQLMLDQSLLPSDWVTNDTIWIEGNAVASKEGKIYNIMRLETAPTVNKAAIISMSDDGSKAEFDYKTGFIDFPGGMSLFNIDYDPVTQRYISLVNNVTDAQTNPNQRNVLQLSYSEDLIHWKIAETILIDDFSGLSWENSMAKIGFQYVDWIFDGDDILMLVREATGDHTYHNANYLTLYRIKDYKKYID